VLWNESRCYWKTQDVKTVEDASGVLNTGGNENGGVGGTKEYI